MIMAIYMFNEDQIHYFSYAPSVVAWVVIALFVTQFGPRTRRWVGYRNPELALGQSLPPRT